MDWKNEAISNYLIFAAGLIIGLLTHLFRTLRRKPVIIELEKENETNLLSLSDKAQDRLEVTYNHEAILEFHETVFQLRNKSRQTLKDIELKLHLSSQSRPQKLFEINVDDPIEDTRKPAIEATCVVNESGHYLHMTAPYINSCKDHQDKITIRVYTPNPLEVSRLVGGGPGWKSNYVDKVAYNERLKGVLGESSSLTDLLLKSAIFLVRKN